VASPHVSDTRPCHDSAFGTGDAAACRDRRLAASIPNTAVTLEILRGVGHGTFRQETWTAFTHVRHFIAHTNASPDIL
jgi:hypothetical protein